MSRFDVDAAAARHVRIEQASGPWPRAYCRHCGPNHDWPCDAVQALDEIRELREQLEGAEIATLAWQHAAYEAARQGT